ncbi:MAG: nitroreductase family protein [Methanobacterium sp.]
MVKSLLSNSDVDLYGTMFKRKSIRKYDQSSLDDSLLNSISEHIHDLTPLYADIKTEVKIISSDDVNLRGMKRAPHYLAVFSENKKGYLTNLGFMIQELDLLFSESGIGSCWQGIPKPKGKVKKSSDLKFIILIAFGYPEEPLYRDNTGEFKRKSIQRITDINDAEELLEPVRLAPSAINSQPWFFTGNKNVIQVYSKTNFLKAILVNKYIPIDIGIAIYHLKVAAEHFGNKIEIIFDEPETSLKGYKYFATVKCIKN